MPTLSSELGRRSGRDSALFDGEIVVLREDGVSDFQKLQNALGGDNDSAIVYYVFDLLHYRGYDLSSVPLEERKRLLAELVATTQSAIARLESGGRPPRIDTLLRIAQALDCELAVELRPRTETERGES